MTWLEFYYCKMQHETKLARKMEPTRSEMHMISSMFADKSDVIPIEEFMPLLTDYTSAYTRAAKKAAVKAVNKSLWQKMKSSASNLFQTPKE